MSRRRLKLSVRDPYINLLRDHSTSQAVRSFTVLTHLSRANSLIDNGLPTNNPDVRVEEERERHAHLKEGEVDKGRMEPEVGFEPFPHDRTPSSVHRSTKRAGMIWNARKNQTSLRKMRRK